MLLLSDMTVSVHACMPYECNIGNSGVFNGHALIFSINCRFYLGRTPCILLRDPELIKQVTVKEFDSFIDRPVSVISRD